MAPRAVVGKLFAQFATVPVMLWPCLVAAVLSALLQASLVLLSKLMAEMH